MRSMLYAGAALMIGASIYGFVDYKRTSHKKEFTTMYEPKKTEAVKEKTEVKSEPVTAVTIKEAKKTRQAKTTGVTPVKEEVTIKEVSPEKEVVAEVKETKTENREVKKRRKLRLSEFSRAPLYDEEEVKVDEQETKTPTATKTVSHK